MKVKLVCWSNEAHLSQVYTGLTMLHREGRIDLEQQIVEPPAPNLDPACPPHLREATKWHCMIEVDGRSHYVDVHDDDDIRPSALNSCEIYLKRGYNPFKPMSAKVRPLGLNYEVYTDGRDEFELSRRFRFAGGWSAAKYLAKKPVGVSEIESPVTDAEPGVLFLCRTWEPEPDRSQEKNAERIQINETRAACIMALRKEFGNRCVAGFAHSDYAARHFPEAIAADARLTKRRNYLQLVRSVPICIATMGLHQSNGWKLGEYVAASRAIACEPLRHRVPELEADRHYLPFRTAAECVEAVGLLMSSTSARRFMAEANRDYYLRRLRPDVMMFRALTETTEVSRIERAATGTAIACSS